MMVRLKQARKKRKAQLMFLITLTLRVVLTAAVDADVFVSGDGLYHTYTIPAVLQTRDPNIVFALCEGRKLSSSDHDWNGIPS